MSDAISAILIVSGGLTAGVFGLFVAPLLLMRLIFGVEALEPANVAVTRLLGLMIGGLGVLLVLAAFDPAIRPPIMALATAEKFAAAALVLGTSLRRQRVAVLMVSADLVMGLLFVAYFLGL
ncbi:hypothetical protein [Brevundimonas sp. Root1279]|uniref:hypothetical protein n=1 Tax=Brevundimonas sp. Root1279 TaxID=1736443 RepID=UPI0006FB8CAE|nr:hypothetical protein [Brevundimonas sp. Root1279]KQW80730.1 hypothetical protein ASC65_12185 [Brevundimonas sp. Root1279]